MRGPSSPCSLWRTCYRAKIPRFVSNSISVHDWLTDGFCLTELFLQSLLQQNFCGVLAGSFYRLDALLSHSQHCRRTVKGAWRVQSRPVLLVVPCGMVYSKFNNNNIFFTLGINDPEGFGKNRRKCVGVTISPGSPQTQRNHVAARRWIAALARKRAGTIKLSLARRRNDD